ncbi:kinetochore component CENP-S-domain-containing protein, partial [Chytriomyces cf. hyalinus JEL632]
LQASIHYTVSKLIASILAENNADVTPTPQFVHAVTAVVLAQCGSLAVDLDSFSKHGKRSVVSVEDVKLCVRKNQALVMNTTFFFVKGLLRMTEAPLPEPGRASR